MEKILVSRLRKMVPAVCWNDYPITADSLKLFDFQRIELVSEPYGDMDAYEARPDVWHLGRIRFLSENGWNDPIRLDTSMDGEVFIEDGNHRYMAAVLSNCEYIECSFSGLCNVLDYLQGRIETVEVNQDEEDEFTFIKDSVVSLIERWSRKNIKMRFTAQERINHFLRELKYIGQI